MESITYADDSSWYSVSDPFVSFPSEPGYSPSRQPTVRTYYGESLCWSSPSKEALNQARRYPVQGGSSRCSSWRNLSQRGVLNSENKIPPGVQRYENDIGDERCGDESDFDQVRGDHESSAAHIPTT